MAGNVFNRYLWLINTIRTFGPISYEEINALWLRSKLNEYGEDLPKKTFRNHLEAIQDTFNLEIVCERKGGYKYSILEDEQQDRWMSAFLNTLSVQASIEEDPLMKDRIIDYDVRLNSLLPLMVQYIKHRTVIQFRIFISAEEVRNSPPMEEVDFDTRNCEDIDIRFHYYCPLGLVQVAEYWYIIGVFVNKNKYAGHIGIFRLIDLSEVSEMVGETATNYPEEFSLKKYIEDLDINRFEYFFDEGILLYSDLMLRGIKEPLTLDDLS